MRVAIEEIEGPEAGRRIELEGPGDYLAGRVSSCSTPDLPIGPADLLASRAHFRLVVGLDECRVRDAGSKNGTFLLGRLGERRIRGERAIMPGDYLRAGGTIFRFVGPVRPEPAEAPRRMRGACGSCGATIDAEVPEAPGDEVDCDLACDACAARDAALRGGGREVRGYLVLSLLGRGAMGAVWKAWQAQTRRLVALKEARSDLRPDARAAALFLREIEVMRAVRHPNLVRLVDYGREGDSHFFTSEFQRGGSLQDALAGGGGRLPPAKAIGLVIQALAGLERMHEAGFVHRDIKPSNILLSTAAGGVARIGDFGLAKRFLSAGSSGVTKPGESAGTVGYMAPEQITDYRRADPRSDIYSMGATLYRLVSGRVPVGEGRDGVLATIEGRLRPIGADEGGLPPGLAEAVARATARDPRDRWEGARAFRLALEAVAAGGPT